MEKTKTYLRLTRLTRLEEVAQERVRLNRLSLDERRDELDAATREHSALRSYRDGYRSGSPAGSPDAGQAQAAALSLAMLAHRQQFVSRLCHEVDRLSELERRRRLAFEQQLECLSDALRTSAGLSQLCKTQVQSLERAASRDEQRRLDEAGQIQYARAVKTADHEESSHV